MSEFRPSPNSLAARLADAVAQAGGRAAVVSRAAIAPNSLHEYLHGREMKLTVAVRIADACGVSLQWLATGTGPRAALQNLQTETEDCSTPVAPDEVDIDLLTDLMRHLGNLARELSLGLSVEQIATLVQRIYYMAHAARLSRAAS